MLDAPAFPMVAGIAEVSAPIEAAPLCSAALTAALFRQGQRTAVHDFSPIKVPRHAGDINLPKGWR